ncbi:MAG: hypothetical protein IPN45_06115 [Actinomycetales bacterium]|nr:hypothetical protein [Actinomycetales bacterium]
MYSTGAWVDGVVTVSAVPAEGFVFAAGAVTSWSFVDVNEPCPVVVTPVAPVVSAVCGPANDVVSASMVGVVYSTGAWVDGVVTVSAVPAEGFVFAAGAVTSWSFVVAVSGCGDATPSSVGRLRVMVGVVSSGDVVVFSTPAGRLEHGQ